MFIWLVISLGVFISSVKTTRKREFIEFYEKQICLNKQFLGYWKNMVQAYADASRGRKLVIPGIKYVKPTNLQLLAVLNERFVSLQFNMISWACYMYYKEALHRPEIEKAETCKKFVNFLSWYNDALAVKYIYGRLSFNTKFRKEAYINELVSRKILKRKDSIQFLPAKQLCLHGKPKNDIADQSNKPRSTKITNQRKESNQNQAYSSTENMFKKMERQLLRLKHMNEIFILHADYSRNIFLNLRPYTKNYLSEDDVMPIKELLSKNKYQDRTKAESRCFMDKIFNRGNGSPASSPLSDYHEDRKYLKDYHNEIYRRLYLYFGSGLLRVKRYLNAFLKTTSASPPYIEMMMPSLRLSEQFWEFIMKIQGNFDKLDYSTFESAISLHAELFKIWLSSYNRIAAPKDVDIPGCYLREQENFMDSTLEFHDAP